MSLYTTRIVLDVLGIEDYGIYNVTGSVIVLFSFISGTMRTTTQRFLSYELGRDNSDSLNNTFVQSLYSYLLIIIAVIVIGETIGLWILNNLVVLPSERIIAANIAYQFTIFSFIAIVIGEPYNAAIIAMERMKLFAYGSILLSLLNLIAALALQHFVFQDYLISYSFFLFLSNLIVTLLYIYYCTREFEFCKLARKKIDHHMIKSMTLFAFWNMLGQITNLLRKQGLNILLSMFFNPSVNAARGISLKINNVINHFSNNFYTAVRPQLVKYYSSDNKDKLFTLGFLSSRLAFLLLLLLVVPVICEIEPILFFWLKEVPSYTVSFTRIALITSLIEVIFIPLDHMMQASGNLKSYQLCICSINILNIPLSFMLFKFGFTPEYALYVNLMLLSLTFAPRLLIARKVLRMNIYNYVMEVIKPLLLPIIISILWTLSYRILGTGSCHFFFMLFIHVFVILATIFLVGINSVERRLIFTFIRDYLKRQ